LPYKTKKPGSLARSIPGLGLITTVYPPENVEEEKKALIVNN